ncbi:MAG: hypothetical protein WDA74_01870 [Spirochaetota bacterium]
MRVFLTAVFLFLPLMLHASGDHLMNTALRHFERGEYYNTITETMRYRYLYPSGERYGESLILSGMASYRGGDNSGAINSFQETFNLFPDSYYGQQGLHYLGMVRLASGSTAFALNNFLEYNYIYKEGYFYEDSLFYLCLARALSEDYNEAQNAIGYYREIFPEGSYTDRAISLSNKIKYEQEKVQKSPLKAAVASALVPGLGYVYTENYMLGLFSFATNGLFIYLIYDGYRKKNNFQMIFFSLVELSFYNYAIMGSIKSAYDYNDSGSFKRELVLGIKKQF